MNDVRPSLYHPFAVRPRYDGGPPVGLDGLQQLHVVVVGHFVAVLLPVLPGAEHVGRVGVNQDVLVIKPPDELHRRSVLDLDAPEPLRRLDDDLRKPWPIIIRM